MNESSKLNIRELNLFTTEIKRDIDVIKYYFNNGIVEGSVDKLNVIKRIMYGGCSFDLLRSKVLRL